MTVDSKALVAALVAAKDIEALEAAIAAASILDNTPGDDRQKLRGKKGISGRSLSVTPPPPASGQRHSCLPLSPCMRMDFTSSMILQLHGLALRR